MELLSNLSLAELEEMLAKKKAEEQAKELKERENFLAEKDLFLDATVAAFCEIHAEMKTLKENTTRRASELYEKMFAMNGKEAKDVNSFTLKNETDTARVVVERQERFEFTEEATVHINTIKDIFKEKFAGESPEMYSLLDHLMMKNMKGDYDPKLLTKVRQQVIKMANPELTKAFEKLTECQRVTATSLYVRAYKKSEVGKWEDITLQFSAI